MKQRLRLLQRLSRCERPQRRRARAAARAAASPPRCRPAAPAPRPPRYLRLSPQRCETRLYHVLWHGGGHYLLQQRRRVHQLAVLQVVNGEVEARLGNGAHEARKHAKRSLTAAEHHHVVPQRVIPLRGIALFCECA